MGKLQGRQERFLKTFIGVGLISQETKHCVPNGWSLAADEFIPIDHRSTHLAGVIQCSKRQVARDERLLPC